MSAPYFGHIGIIIKINNIPYILESTEDYYNCEYSKYKKNGVILHRAYDRIKDYSGRVYLSRNNLDKFISNDYIKSFIERYKHLKFLENNIGCIEFIKKFLFESNLLKKDNLFLFQNQFNDKNIYNINFKNIKNIKVINDYLEKNKEI